MTKVINIGVPAELYIKYNTRELKDIFITAVYEYVREGRLTYYNDRIVNLPLRVDEAIAGIVRAGASKYEMSIIEFTTKLFRGSSYYGK